MSLDFRWLHEKIHMMMIHTFHLGWCTEGFERSIQWRIWKEMIKEMLLIIAFAHFYCVCKRCSEFCTVESSVVGRDVLPFFRVSPICYSEGNLFGSAHRHIQPSLLLAMGVAIVEQAKGHLLNCSVHPKPVNLVPNLPRTVISPS